jgi:Toprim domain
MSRLSSLKDASMIDFETLSHLSRGQAVADAPCPLCSSGCKTTSNRIRKVLRIYNKGDGFSTFKCQRCGASGYAHAANNGPASRKSSAYDEAVDVIAAFKTPPIAAVKQQPDQDKLRRARWIFRQSLPARGTIAEIYLRTRRCWVDSENIRFLPARNGYDPALIVPFGIPTEPEPGLLDIAAAHVHGVQLIKLKADGSGKADVEPKKMTLGQCVGWPIVLAAPNDLLALVIAEGIEDALTAHVATGCGAWASGGAGRLPALADKVPRFIEHVAIMTDDDRVGRAGANKLGTLLQRRGIDVKLLLVPQEMAS